MAALQDSYTDLNNRIEQSTSAAKRIEAANSNRQRTSSIVINNEKDKVNQSIEISKRKHSRKQQLIESNSSIEDFSTNQQSLKTIHHEIIYHAQNRHLVSSSPSEGLSSSGWSQNNMLIPFCLIIMLILLSVNIFLFIKLNEIDRMTDSLIEKNPLWSHENSDAKQENHWSILLKRQEEFYQTKLTGLRLVLMSTHDALKNVTDALNELSKMSSGTGSTAPIDHLHSL